MEVNRIVIGKKAFNIGCSVAFSALTGQWTVAYKNGPLLAGGENHVIEGDSINLLRYYSGGTLDHAHPYFIVMEIDATTMKGFSKFKNKSTETKGAEYISVVIEFPCRGHIDEVVKALRGSREKEGANWSGFNDDSNVELSLDEVQLYAKALGLMDTTDIDSKSRPLSTRNRRKGRGTACMFDHFRKKRFLDGRKGETVLLVYPFAGDTEVIDAAAIGLTEANCAALKAESIKPNGASEPNSVEGESKTSALRDSEVAPLATMPENPPAVAANTNQRGDYVMIRVKDYDRLDPGEWLNDSLIDFWMQW